MTRAHGTGSSHDDTQHGAVPAADEPETWLHDGFAGATTSCVQPPSSPRQLEWRTDVEDATGRPRQVVVTDADGRITVLPPPGASFSLNPDQADQFAFAILAADNHAQRLTRW